MKNDVKELLSIEELDGVLSETSKRPALIFKHSLTCPISARAFREFQAYLDDADPSLSYNLITVQTARPVSNEAAARLQLPHETPQAILVRDGREVWNASHFSITAASLQEAIQSLK